MMWAGAARGQKLSLIALLLAVFCFGLSAKLALYTPINICHPTALVSGEPEQAKAFAPDVLTEAESELTAYGRTVKLLVDLQEVHSRVAPVGPREHFVDPASVLRYSPQLQFRPPPA